MTTLSSEGARRSHVLEVAARLLAEEGPHGLTLRRVAAAAGGSTQIVYTLFGGKPGLADALYAEGFARLAAVGEQALAAAPLPGDPERLMAFGRAYCAFALAEPAFFSVMFGRAIAGFTPRPETRRACRAGTLGRVVQTAAECLAAGTLVADDAEALAHSCWVTAHGLASLLVAGLLPVDDASVEARLRVAVDAHRPPG